MKKQSYGNGKTVFAFGNAGLTMIEVVVSITILGLIMLGLQQVLAGALAAHAKASDRQMLLAQARYAVDRIVMFAQQTDGFNLVSSENLQISERVLDMYNNADNTFLTTGDGYLDADNDRDGLVNEGGSDPKEWVSFTLDKTDAANWKLKEALPNYGTTTTGDSASQTVVCERVTGFTCSLLSSGLLEIQLTVNDGKNQVSFKTRARAMYIH